MVCCMLVANALDMGSGQRSVMIHHRTRCFGTLEARLCMVNGVPSHAVRGHLPLMEPLHFAPTGSCGEGKERGARSLGSDCCA